MALFYLQDEIDCEGNANLLKESDFIAFFDQFPFTDLYQYILMVPLEGTLYMYVMCVIQVLIFLISLSLSLSLSLCRRV